MRTLSLLSLVGLVTAASIGQAVPAAAQGALDERALVEQVYGDHTLRPELFSPLGFGNPLMFGVIADLIDQEHRQLGALRSVRKIAPHVYAVALSSGTCFSEIRLNEQGKITEFTVDSMPPAAHG